MPLRPPVAFHSLHLTEQMAGPELRFTWHSSESGDIQLRTSLREHDVEMAVSTERPDAASAMRAELPSLDLRLHEHALRLGNVSIVASQGGSSTSLGMGGQHNGNREWNAPSNFVVQTANERSAETHDNALPICDNGHVSVLA